MLFGFFKAFWSADIVAVSTLLSNWLSDCRWLEGWTTTWLLLLHSWKAPGSSHVADGENNGQNGLGRTEATLASAADVVALVWEGGKWLLQVSIDGYPGTMEGLLTTMEWAADDRLAEKGADGCRRLWLLVVLLRDETDREREREDQRRKSGHQTAVGTHRHWAGCLHSLPVPSRNEAAFEAPSRQPALLPCL